MPLPVCVRPSVPTVLAFDNIDRQEEVLAGAGTSHRVNGIIVQPTSSSCAPPTTAMTANMKAKQCTIKPPEAQLPKYVLGESSSPTAIVRI